MDRSAFRTADEILAQRIYRVLGAVFAFSVASVVLGSAGLGWRWDWTGFPDNGTWWAWFSLLVLPVVLAVLPVWLKTRARHSSLWRLGLVAAAVASIIVIIGGYAFGWSWVGFYGADPKDTVRLWDWLTVLVQPVALALLPFWLGLKRGMTRRMAILAGAVGILFSVVVICGYAVPWDWTGFTGNKLWDWIHELVVPFALPVALILLDTQALTPAARRTPQPASQDAGGADRGQRRGALRVPASVTAIGVVAVLVLGGVGVWLSSHAHSGVAKPAADTTGRGSTSGSGRDGGSTPQTASSNQKDQSLHWQTLPGPPGHSISGASAATYQGQIWVAGGMGTTVLVYDPLTGRWHTGPSLPAPRRLGALASDGQRLYYIGGIVDGPDDRRGLQTVYQLDSSKGPWTNAPQLLAGRFSGAAVWDGRHIMYGGGAAYTDLRHRAPASEIWALMPTRWVLAGRLPKPREHLAAASNGSGTVWFVGGTDVPAGPGGLSAEVDVIHDSGPKYAGSLPDRVQGLSAVWAPTWGVCALGGATSQPNAPHRIPVVKASCLPGGPWPNLPKAAYLAASVTLADTVYVLADTHMFILRLPR